MSIDRRHRKASERDSYTNLQQRKRFRSDRLRDLKCTSLLPSASSNVKENSPKRSPWKGWKSLSNEPSPQINKENKDFPPLNNGNIFDPWYTPEPIKNWADYMENEELERNNRIRFDTKKRFKRKLLLSDKSDERHLKTKEPKPILTDEHRLAQRQKQIDFGKNTAAYGRYIIEKPRHCRSIEDPRTPDKFQVCSTRSWTGQIRCWRRKLHEWDPPSAEDQVDTFALVLNSSDKDDVNSIIKWKQNMGSSSTSQNSSEDFFHDLQIDECLLPEKLCI